jgi:ATP-dependent DNA helicase RecG
VNNYLQTPIEYLKGVGPKKAELLKAELGVFTFEDLLFYFPFRYIDRSKFHKIKDLLELNGPAQIKGRIVGLQEAGVGRNKRLIAKFQDDTGSIDLVWFKGAKWIKSSLKVNEEIQIYGRAKQYGGKWNIPHPEISSIDPKGSVGFQPIYSSTEKLASAGLHTKGLEKLTKELLTGIKGQLEEKLPDSIRNDYKLIGIEEAIQMVHNPQSEDQARNAQFRLKFEELFYLQLELLVRKKITMQKSKGIILEEVGDVFNEFYKNHIPFELTGAQKRVLKEIRRDLNSGAHMNRLLQGDVGSGKTLVALLTMLLAVGNGYQAALMAPTEILAIQHFESVSEMLEKMDIKVALLTGSTKKKVRTELHEELLSGEIDILIGTHALLEEVVQFKDLGIVVIDEQHRFGVAQRARMWKKNTVPPHVLIMTATPIPRTLAMTFYGDLDVSVIDELPPGRKPITTIHRFDSSRLRMFGFLKEEIAKGRQVYIVYPLIRESEKLDFNNLMDGYEAITRAFPMPDYQVSMVHGKMKPEDKEFEMNRFSKGETQIMVATTVIEVGVNVPNASVMVIESAERFGLSQLHQLRGRVGRGAEKSYCILMTGDKLGSESLKRMQTMVRTNDGFEIAEADLQLRGPGDIMGTQQSGLLDLKIANLAKDSHLVVLARDAAKKLLTIDPDIKLEENKAVRTQLSEQLKSRPHWGRIA